MGVFSICTAPLLSHHTLPPCSLGWFGLTLNQLMNQAMPHPGATTPRRWEKNWPEKNDMQALWGRTEQPQSWTQIFFVIQPFMHLNACDEHLLTLPLGPARFWALLKTESAALLELLTHRQENPRYQFHMGQERGELQGLWEPRGQDPIQLENQGRLLGWSDTWGEFIRFGEPLSSMQKTLKIPKGEPGTLKHPLVVSSVARAQCVRPG